MYINKTFFSLLLSSLREVLRVLDSRIPDFFEDSHCKDYSRCWKSSKVPEICTFFLLSEYFVEDPHCLMLKEHKYTPRPSEGTGEKGAKLVLPPTEQETVSLKYSCTGGLNGS